jgi:hypothetical protein
LYLKNWFDRLQRHRRSRRLLAQFVALAQVDLPELIPVPSETGYPGADAARGNYHTLARYYDALLDAKSFLDANEKLVIEDAPLNIIHRLYQCKWRFDRIVGITKHYLDEEGPVDDRVLQEIRPSHEALKQAGSFDST